MSQSLPAQTRVVIIGGGIMVNVAHVNSNDWIAMTAGFDSFVETTYSGTPPC